MVSEVILGQCRDLEAEVITLDFWRGGLLPGPLTVGARACRLALAADEDD